MTKENLQTVLEVLASATVSPMHPEGDKQYGRLARLREAVLADLKEPEDKPNQ